MSWPLIELGELMASRVPSVNPAKYPDEEFELWSIPAFDEGAPDLTVGSEIGSSKKVVAPDDVLLSRIVPHIRRSWVVTSPSNGARQIASSEWMIFRSDRIYAPYLRHVLVGDSFHAAFMGTVAGVGGSLLRARPEAVKQIKIALPPLPEQQRIAAILDQADALRRLRRQSLSRLLDLRSSSFNEAFKNQNDIETIPLSDVVAPGTIVTYGIVQAGEEYEGGVPYIRTGDIKDGIIQRDDLRHTDPAIASKFERSRVRAGEIVMSIRATVGTTAVVPDSLDGANLTQGTARISPGPLTHKTYLLEYLRSASVQQWIQRQVKGATFREITLSRLRELPVKVPARNAQDKFAQSIEALERQEQILKSSLGYLDSLFSSLQHRAFRGEL